MESAVIDGIYAITFRGEADWGSGMVMLWDGSLLGCDISGVQFDGTYRVDNGELTLDMVATVPPGTSLVQGNPPQSTEYSFPIQSRMPLHSLSNNEPVLFETPPGPVNVLFRRLRNLEGTSCRN